MRRWTEIGVDGVIAQSSGRMVDESCYQSMKGRREDGRKRKSKEQPILFLRFSRGLV